MVNSTSPIVLDLPMTHNPVAAAGRGIRNLPTMRRINARQLREIVAGSNNVGSVVHHNENEQKEVGNVTSGAAPTTTTSTKKRVSETSQSLLKSSTAGAGITAVVVSDDDGGSSSSSESEDQKLSGSTIPVVAGTTINKGKKQRMLLEDNNKSKKEKKTVRFATEIDDEQQQDGTTTTRITTNIMEVPSRSSLTEEEKKGIWYNLEDLRSMAQSAKTTANSSGSQSMIMVLQRSFVTRDEDEREDMLRLWCCDKKAGRDTKRGLEMMWASPRRLRLRYASNSRLAVLEAQEEGGRTAGEIAEVYHKKSKVARNFSFAMGIADAEACTTL